MPTKKQTYKHPNTWTVKQRELLLTTPYDKLKTVFPNIPRRILEGWRRELKAAKGQVKPDIDAEVAEHLAKKAQQKDNRELSRAYAHINTLQATVNALTCMKDAARTKPLVIKKAKASSLKNRATALILSSDQHGDEVITPDKVDGKNEHNWDIALQRFHKMQTNGVKLLRMAETRNKIDHLILWLGGDSFSGDIHEETSIVVSMRPLESALKLLSVFQGMILYLRSQLETETKLTIVGSYGNHGRITQERKFIALKREHNLEWFMYHMLAQFCKDIPNTEMIVPQADHTFVDAYGFIMRFSHGDLLRAGGRKGVMLNNAWSKVQSWNTVRHADLDIVGHCHSFIDGQFIVMNGCQVGYNPYAIHVGAAFEEPSQTFFLVDENRGKTLVAPIFVK